MWVVASRLPVNRVRGGGGARRERDGRGGEGAARPSHLCFLFSGIFEARQGGQHHAQHVTHARRGSFEVASATVSDARGAVNLAGPTALQMTTQRTRLTRRSYSSSKLLKTDLTSTFPSTRLATT